jgi:hypothetical protein
MFTTLEKIAQSGDPKGVEIILLENYAAFQNRYETYEGKLQLFTCHFLQLMPFVWYHVACMIWQMWYLHWLSSIIKLVKLMNRHALTILLASLLGYMLVVFFLLLVINHSLKVSDPRAI